jgi:hypothetical protein
MHHTRKQTSLIIKLDFIDLKGASFRMARELRKELADANWSQVMNMVSRDRNLAKTWASKSGQLTSGPFSSSENIQGLPIHDAVSVGAPLDVIDALIRANSDGLIQRERVASRLPLHVACKRAPVDPRLIKLLVKYSPEAAAEADKFGRIPLHYALENSCSQEVVKHLLRACPNAARAQDHEGTTPLHLACRFGHSTIVIGAILELNPSSCIMVTADGTTALGCAFENVAPNKNEVVSLLARYKRRIDRRFRIATQPSSRRLLV